MADMRLDKLDPPVNLDHDHVLGPPDAELTLVEYGSYSCGPCHAVHEVIEGLRNRFDDRMRYVFRHLPMADSEDAIRGQSWPSTPQKPPDVSGKFMKH